MDLIAELQEARRLAAEHNMRYREVFGAEYNKKSETKPRVISKEDRVFVLNNHKVGANPKLQPMFLGPYEVVSVNDTNVKYRVGKKTRIAHFNRVKTVKESIAAGLQTIAHESEDEEEESVVEIPRQGDQTKTIPTQDVGAKDAGTSRQDHRTDLEVEFQALDLDLTDNIDAPTQEERRIDEQIKELQFGDLLRPREHSFALGEEEERTWHAGEELTAQALPPTPHPTKKQGETKNTDRLNGSPSRMDTCERSHLYRDKEMVNMQTPRPGDRKRGRESGNSPPQPGKVLKPSHGYGLRSRTTPTVAPAGGHGLAPPDFPIESKAYIKHYGSTEATSNS